MNEMLNINTQEIVEDSIRCSHAIVKNNGEKVVYVVIKFQTVNEEDLQQIFITIMEK